MSENAVPVTYCTPDDVANTLDLPDPNDAMGKLLFTDITHPSYDYVCEMIASNEDMIDRRVRRSWRENIVRDKLDTISSYWHDINSRRSDYYLQGGDFVQLRKNLREWNPFPVQTYQHDGTGAVVTQEATAPDGRAIYVPEIVGGTGSGEFSWGPAFDQNGQKMFDNDGVPIFVNTEEMVGGTPTENFVRAMTPVVVKTLYEGDRIMLRSTTHNMWRNASYVPLGDDYKGKLSYNIWFDYPYGKLYIRTPPYNQYKANSLKITYRYGSEEPVPAAIKRLCCLMTASQILTMQYFNVKVGVGGDLGSTRNDTLSRWKEEMGEIMSSFQRSGSVHSMLR